MRIDMIFLETTWFEKELNAKIIIEHNKHHLWEEANIKQLPNEFKAILEISQ